MSKINSSIPYSNRIHSNEETQSLQIEYDKMEHAAYTQNELLLDKEKTIAEIRLATLKIQDLLIKQHDYISRGLKDKVQEQITEILYKL